VAPAFQPVLAKNYIQKDFLLTREWEYFSFKKSRGNQNAKLLGPVFLF
jgi:hypothetical protein